ncbi:hypothetical protein MHYP_G00123250 [Metynnis hypsauchen]
MCGFSPPDADAKEWLCLNCQMQRALGGAEPPGPPMMKPPSQPGKAPSPSQPPGKQSASLAQKKDATQNKVLPQPANQQNKPSEGQEAPEQFSSSAAKQANATATPPSQQKPSQQQTAKGGPSLGKSEPPPKAEPPEEQSGFFGFGFGGVRSRSPSPQPAVSAVSGKVLGFGSSFLSSASNLISSAVQDEPSTTPPTSRKGSAVSQTSAKAVTTPPALRKGSEPSKDSPKPPATYKQEEMKPEQKKPEEPQPTKATVAQTKNQPTSTQPSKLNPVSPKPIPKACPICKVDLKKDPPNYSACTECKSTVCNQCGFNPTPHQSEGKHWVCLNCQTQRALKGVESQGPPSLKPLPQLSEATTQKEDSTTGQIQKQSTAQPTKPSFADQTVTPKETLKQQPSSTGAKPVNQRQPPDQQTTKSGPPTAKSEPSSKEEPSHNESSFFGFGFGARSRSPSPQPAASAVSGKVLGFGSSLFSSASNLISSAVQDEPSTTPPTSRKGSTMSQSSANTTSTPPASRKISSTGTEMKQPTAQKEKTDRQLNDQKAKAPLSQTHPELSTHMPKVDKDAHSVPKACPLCKAELKKDPPSYNICTECKKAVCNLCGFNPMPHQTEVVEWLCLNCQTQRALGDELMIPPKNPGPPHKAPSSQQIGASVVDSTKKTANPKATAPQEDKKVDVVQKLQDKQTKALNGTPPVHKPPWQETEKPHVDSQRQSKTVKSETQEESGFFGFGFGGARSRSPSPQPAVSAVSGKVLGFGSSFLNSASNLISSAVQDEPFTVPPTSRKGSSVSQTTPKTTPPTSRKGSSVSQISHKPESPASTPAASRKGSETSQDVKRMPYSKDTQPPSDHQSTEKKAQQVQPSKTPSTQAKRDQPLIESAAVDKSAQPLPKTCPLCKAEIKKDPPNYSMCTDCKSTVCNLCGFNPMPHQIKEWLCLKCQTQRASEALSVQQQAKKTPPSLQQKEAATSEGRQKKEGGLPDETIKKGQKTAVKQPADTSAGVQEKQLNPTPTQQPNQQLPIKQQDAAKKPQSQTSKSGPSPAKADLSQESSGFFGFGGARSRSPSPQPAVSAVSGKVLGFGSSLFSSASNLISSAVQDEPSTTPPTSRKGSQVSQSSIKTTTPPSSRKGSGVSQTSLKTTIPPLMSRKGSKTFEDFQKKQTGNIKSQTKQNQEDDTDEKTKPVIHQGKESSQGAESKPELSKVKETSQLIPNECLLCKVEIKKEPPNYNTCTHCKNIVCIQCGFNPTPHQTEVKEWLCLNCQMQLTPGPPPAQPQAQVTKVPSLVSPQKKEASAPEKDKKPVAHEKPEDKQVEADKKQPLNTHNTKPSSQDQVPKQQVPVKPQQSKDAISERPKEESGFFGFGFGSRSRSPSPQPAVSGKVLGFGSSILSSASNLISSAVQDGPSTTPSTSRKNSTVSQTSEKTAPTPPTSRKGSEASQTCKPTATPPISHGVPTQGSPKMNPKSVTKPPNEQNQKENLEEKKPGVKKPSPTPEPISMDTHTTKTDTPKAAESTQPLPKVCPLCKVEIKKDPPNYNVCTECKNVVCNLCGFNPAPDQTEMQQASGPPKPVQPQSTKAPPPASPQKDVQAQGSLQRSPQLQESKGTPLEQRLTVDATKEGQKLHVAGKPDDKPPGAQSQKPTSTPSSPKPSPAKPPPPPKVEPANEESGFFGLGFGGTRSRSPSPQTAASAVSGKLLGFSSSIISSASNLITSAVQDEPSTTPPTSRKGSAVSQTSIKTAPTPPASRKGSVLQTSPKLASSDETKASATQKKEEKKPADEAQKAQSATAPSAPVKGDENLSNLPKMCPLCKEKFTHPPNYNTCTSCKATVCNLCGFNPMPHKTEVKEWLCLNCQMQQAPGLLPAQPQPDANKVSPPALKKEAPTAGPTQKASPSEGATEKDQKPAASEKPNDKPISTERQKPTTASAEQKPPVAESVRPQKPELIEEQSGFFGFGFGGARSRSPSPHSAASAVSGKVLGFGSSFLSSASNLISSAVQDESSTTPPTSRKGSTISQNPEKKVPTPPSSRKASVAQKQEENKSEDHGAKAPVSLMKKNTPPLQIPKACPLCMVDLKKDPPNYNMCTECNSTVCNLCGFSPIPQKTEVKEWLCLTCQMKRAPGPPPAQPQPLANKVSPSASPQKKETPGFPQKKQVDATKTDQKPTVTEKPEDKTIPVDKSMAGSLTQQPAPESQKAPEQSISTIAKQASTTARPSQQKPSQQQTANVGPSPAMSEQPPKAEPPKEESGFFGFGGARSRSPSPQTAVSAVSGKVLGFGSSFLSSASNLISSAVQDEPSTTPPTSRKGSTVSQSSVKNVPTPPPSQKGSVAQKKEERKEPQHKSEEQLTKAPVSQMKKDEPPSEPLGDCPLCKVQFKKDPPNYNTCTECKSTVCNLCGFSPMPQQTEVKEWLCLNCQMKRAPGPPPAQPQSQAENVPPPVSPQKKEAPTPGVPQKQPSLKKPVDVAMKDQKPPTPGKKEEKPNPDESQKSSAVPSTQQPALPQKVEPPKMESGFFGIGGARSRSPSPQAAASAVSGKVLGFGSSFLSSASNFISSAVQDETSTTPPTSRKASTVSQSSVKNVLTPPPSRKGSVAQKKEERKEPQHKSEEQLTKAPVSQMIKDEPPSEPLGDCPLCKVQFKKDPPNYNTCTECKSTVCNLCGFSPMPQQTEVKEWLCLNCQMKRAPGPPPAQPQSQAENVPPPVSPQKKEAPTPGVPQKKPSLPVDVVMKDQKPPTPGKKEDKPNPDESQKSTAVPSTQQPALPQKVEPPKEESGFLGFGGARSRSPSPQAAASAVSGKVLGFGSSFLSSASNFISSAVQDEPSTTPPTSRKASTVSQSSVKNVPTPPPSRKGSVTQKKEERKEPQHKSEEQLTKAPVSQMKKDEAPSEPLGDCPLCKVQFKKDPPNYNTCTECKSTVCNLCGFSPMPQQTEVKEWLCLNCQMKRAPGPPPAQPQSQAEKVPPPVSPQKKKAPTPGDATMKAQKPPTPGKKEDRPNPDESQKSTAVPSTQQPAPATPAIPQKVEPPKMESGFFGFGGARSRSPSPQAAASAVSGKVLGFGSSFLSSASNLISSAVQDEPSTTPPTSRKGSTVSAKITPTPPASRKASVAQTKEEKEEMEMKPEDQSKVPISLVKKDEPIKQCPLCKVDIKKDPPNYNTCTECKNIVCNLCGFSPMPQQTEVKEWLCLHCQMKRAPGAPLVQPQQEPNKVPPPASPQKKEASPIGKLNTQTDTKKPISTPTSQQPSTAESAPPPKSEASKEESSFFSFGFGGPRSRPSSPQPAASAVSGKVLGFGSSIFSTASNLISSAVHDEASTTPPPSRKDSTASMKTPSPLASRKASVEPEKILQGTRTKISAEETKTSTTKKEQEKKLGEIVPNDSTKVVAPSKAQHALCPICKQELNVGSNEIPNYNTCTECKNTVCNLCGFNPVPHQTERALKGMEPPVTKPQAEPDTVSTSIQPPKSLTPKTATDAAETNKKELTQIQEPPKDVSAAAMLDENKDPVPPCVQKENILITDMKKEEALPKVEDKTAEKKETQVQLSSTVEGVSAQRPSSEIMLVKEDQKAAGPPKPIIEQEAVGQPTDTGAEKGRVLEKPEKPQTKPSPREQETLKQESGFFGFGFGSAKSQPAPSKPSETSNRKLGSLTETPSAQSVSAVSGKVLGFGSSILSSASNLISSAVQDESSRTPPSSRKGSSVSQTSIKTPTPPTSRRGSAISQASVKTPPTSRKGSAASQASLRMPSTKDTKSSGVQMLDQKKPDQKSDVKLDGTPESAKSSAPLQPATKPIQSSCPICKVELNIGSVDPPNFNICTECKNNVCSQCGFDPMPDQTKVKEWLCLNCQMQRSVRATEPPGTPMLKPTSSEKDSQAPPAADTLTEPKPGVSSPTPVSEKNIPVPSPSKKDIPAPTTVQTNTDLKQPPSKELPQQKAPAQEKPSKPQPEIAKGTPSPIKSAPPPQAEAPKQESSFFGFGFGKSQPTPAKTSDSMTGKLFGFGGLTETASRSPSPQSVANVSGKVLGFGSSIFSSASNLISSAVQDEPASSPPTSRKGSTVSQSSGKTSTPPTSRKGSAASQASLRMPQGEPKAPVFKKPDEKKTEEPHLTKALPLTAKQEASTGPDKVAAPSEPSSKATPSICQLCKVELNVGSKEPPNYNTCTKCKDVVCNLCGFNPMPHLAEVHSAIRQKIWTVGLLPYVAHNLHYAYSYSRWLSPYHCGFT